MKDQDIRVTDTNSAKDFSGLILGIEVPLFRWIIFGLVAGLGIFTAILTVEGIDLGTKLILSLLPTTGTVCFILFFCQGKPSGYFQDCLDTLVNGGDASPLKRSHSNYDDESFS